MNTEIITEKFTPGPWKFLFAKWANEAPTQGYLIEAVDSEKPIAAFNAKSKNDVSVMTDELINQYRMPTGTYMSVDEAEANAKLIAAAPEMYEALKNIVAHEEDAGLFDRIAGDNASGHDLGQSKELGELISKIKLLLKKATQ